eukprot:gb/GECG01000640.1/.p1 GENE.gb/GECG01000640.1/~~gb/GECG01000640.1/.p1  ORF type:complete len:628 (+),score=86.90 gb/GECG01000640.1/:1-1884(+)
MEGLVVSALDGVRKLYNAFKDYKVAASEAEDLAHRLSMLDSMLQRVPTDDDSIRTPLERVAQTVDNSYSAIMERLQPKKGIWRKVKELASSAADRQAFSEIAWEIFHATSDLNMALTLDNRHDLRRIREILENKELINEQMVKQFLALVAVNYENEPINPKKENESDDEDMTWGMSSIRRYSLDDLIWEDGEGPTRDSPERCLIRKGGFGSVYRAKLRGVGDVAVKNLNIDPNELKGKRYKEFKRECVLLHRASTNPNVVSFFGIVKTKDSIGLVTDLAKGGSLFAAMNEEDHEYWSDLPTALKLKALLDLLVAVNWMHSLGLVHADLKPQNILLAEEMEDASVPPSLWVSDFGLAHTTRTIKTSRGSALCPKGEGPTGGTLGFMAPETLSRSETTKESDIFSLSVTLWSALSGEEPFKGVVDAQQYLLQLKNEGLRPNLDQLSRDVPTNIVKILQQGWSFDADQRPTIETMLNEWSGEATQAIYATLGAVYQVEEAAKTQDFARVHDLKSSVNDRDATGNTALHRLIQAGNESVFDAVEWLLIDEDLPFDVDIQNEEGKTILHLAVEGAHVDLADTICARSPDPTLKDGAGRSVSSFLQTCGETTELYQRIYMEYRRGIFGHETEP